MSVMLHSENSTLNKYMSIGNTHRVLFQHDNGIDLSRPPFISSFFALIVVIALPDDLIADESDRHCRRLRGARIPQRAHCRRGGLP